VNNIQRAAVGLIIAAGALVRPMGSLLSSPAAAGSGEPTITKREASPEKTPGPWFASCKYWAAAHWLGDPASRNSVIKSGAVDAPDSTPSPQENEAGCVGGNTLSGWGIPAQIRKNNVAIHAITAIVPDPVHTHLSLEFDRTIDALLQAAADNGYVSTYFWLPWKTPAASLASEAVSASTDVEDPERERQPGLIVLRYSTRLKYQVNEDQSIDVNTNFSNVIYLFIVGQTPSSGMNGAQLQNAFRYEQFLKANGASLSMKDPSQMAIIGPDSSGSAASLREAIEAAHAQMPALKVDVAGNTYTQVAADLLSHSQYLSYVSFGDNSAFERRELERRLQATGFSLHRVAILVEDGTVFGQQSAATGRPRRFESVIIRFPREISLLRNAQPAPTGKGSSQSDSEPSPYLRLSLKDSTVDDSIPHFSRENTPFSQEAQLMAIAHQLQLYRSQFIVIVASNVLDQLFLAQFLHRACPDARLISFGSDLLFEREIDNVPFIGSVTITPYGLTTFTNASSSAAAGIPLRAFPDSLTESYYNAASYIFWDGKRENRWEGLAKRNPELAEYRNPFGSPGQALHTPLWATTVGSDGYYPLAILNECASDSSEILPAIVDGNPKPCDGTKESAYPALSELEKLPVYPSFAWSALCLCITFLCVAHSGVMVVANYWSPFTRDVAIRQNDHPRRRSMYVNIGSVMLFCMAVIVAYPLFPVSFICSVGRPSIVISVVTIAAGAIAFLVTGVRTWKHLGPRKNPAASTPAQPEVSGFQSWFNHNLFFVFNAVAWCAFAIVPIFWIMICNQNSTGGQKSYAGLFFSYRCLHPGSGVSPVVPLLLLLLAWYLWSVFQTLRLRFSDSGRPVLPASFDAGTSYPLFVSDDELALCKSSRHGCLYRNITCLLITPEIIRRFWPALGNKIHAVLACFYTTVFVVFVFILHVRSLDRIVLDSRRMPTLYEFLIFSLFFPLVVIAFTGWLRMIFVWGALRRGLLDRLEFLPIRYAFTRLHGVSWMAMIRQGGLREYWRDMARSTESMRQIIHDDEVLQHFIPAEEIKSEDSPVAKIFTREYLLQISRDLETNIKDLRLQIDSHQKAAPVSDIPKPATLFTISETDRPDPAYSKDLEFMSAIEHNLAAFGQALLARVLIPYWTTERSGTVESGDDDAMPLHARRSSQPEEKHDAIELHAGLSVDDPDSIRAAEEFIAIRYVSLIRAVLVNMRYIMAFVSLSFVLGIIAWNAYPFQPRQYMDWLFTAMLAFLGTGVISVFAQMHRDPILSRITDTKANQLGLDFYVRIVTFGALPVLTWLAYQFPEVGGTLLRFVKPGLEVIK
jgi:hypothetical protein